MIVYTCKVCRAEWSVAAPRAPGRGIVFVRGDEQLEKKADAPSVILLGKPYLVNYCPDCAMQYFEEVRNDGVKEESAPPSFDTVSPSPSSIFGPQVRVQCCVCRDTHTASLAKAAGKEAWVVDERWVYDTAHPIRLITIRSGFIMAFCPSCAPERFVDRQEPAQGSTPSELPNNLLTSSSSSSTSTKKHVPIGSSSSSASLEQKMQQYLWDIRLDPEKTAAQLALELLTCPDDQFPLYEELECLCLSVHH